MDWSVSMTSQGIASVEWQLCMTYHDDSDACMSHQLQCLLLLFFFYSFSILSRHDLGILFWHAIVKMYCLSK